MTSAARALRDAIEPFHAFTYFLPELRSPKVEGAGFHPRATYFALRSAPMGPVGPEVVAAVFYGFNPAQIAAWVPAVWDVLSPEEAWAFRLEGLSRGLERLLPDGFDADAVEEATELAAAAIEDLVIAGRPLAAAHAAMPLPDDPVQRLWRHIAVIREYRGDGHVAALVTHGVGPIESLVTAGGFSNLSEAFHRRSRGWSEEQFDQCLQRCVDAGWVEPDWTLTAAGNELRTTVEEATDLAMAPVLDRLRPEAVTRLTGLMTSMSEAIVSAGGFG